MNPDSVLREQLLALLRGGNAHMTFDQAVVEFPLEHINSRPPHVSYTFWHLLEHIRIAQQDVLDFIHDPKYVAPKWPEGYWPHPEKEADGSKWQKTLDDFRAGLKAFRDLVEDSNTDFFSPIPHAPEYTVFREVLVIADHNAYHIGEFAILRDVMVLWPDSRA